ncbi:uncharacterized protein LOC126831692 [Patella vulgata]|uniref:uncharacterized protein LOC126831692 n=1 Tax=Patella vulgata TaxID=6465 RepID=UPI0024A84D4E|nr:uncharacterized protein LOC126831692 [Patella vulgata]
MSRYHTKHQKSIRLSRLPALSSPNSSQYKCSVAGCQEASDSPPSLIAHLKTHLVKGDQICCPISPCKSLFKIKSSFSSHLTRKHHNWTKDSFNRQSVDDNITSDSEYSAVDNYQLDDVDQEGSVDNIDIDEYDTIADENDEDISVEDYESNFMTSFALFYLKLQAKQLIPQSTIQFIVEEIGNLYSLGWKYMRKMLKRKLVDQGLSNDVAEQIH